LLECRLTALDVEFPPQQIEKQLETAVKWGRYAEVLAYDDAAGRIYLEETGAHAEPKP